MAPPSKDKRARLLEPLATDFAAFRTALGVGATEVGIIRDAVRAFIDARVARDEELKQRYGAERDRLRATRHQPIRLVKSEGDTTA